MPSRNIVKQYVEGGYYHVYNRGVEKRDIFLDEQDYYVFLKYFRAFLSNEAVFEGRTSPRINLSDRVQLVAYCLMPNHYHLLIHQDALEGMTELMRRAMTGYAKYFNDRHNRIGGLFQDHYKAALVSTDEYLMHVSRYIHLNPSGIKEDIWRYPYSSLRYFVEGAPDWLAINVPVALVGGADPYRAFVNDRLIDSQTLIGELSLD